MPYLWPADNVQLRQRVALALCMLIGQQIAAVAIAPLLGAAVDLVIGENFTTYALAVAISGFIIARFAQNCLDELKHYFFARVAQRAIRKFALQTFQHLHSLSLRFHLDRQTGGLSRVIERGVKSIELLITFAAFHILPTILQIILVCGMLWFLFDWYYAVICLVTVTGYAAYTIIVTEWRLQFRRQMNSADQSANTRAIDSLLNHETVKYFNAEKIEYHRYDTAMQNYETAAVKNRTSLSLLNIGQGGIIAVGLFIVMMMAGVAIRDDSFSPGDFVVIYSYVIHLYQPLNFLGSVYREIRQALTDMAAMFKLLKEPQEVSDVPNAPPLTIKNGAVEFKNVRFSYGRYEILKDISFAIPAGTKTAIVGSSGAGKSTIARLLFRFYDPQQGDIFIDGQNIRLCRQESTRAAIAVIPQDIVLFNDTLRYNIAYGASNATDDDIQRASQLAAIDKFINALPEGYDTTVGERGLKLSGGEKQRIAIARAIIKNPTIYIFDEATSALDSHTEAEIQQALNVAAQSRTTLSIAHRLSTIVDADEILVLHRGKITERGKHQELLARQGIYADLWRRQQEQIS